MWIKCNRKIYYLKVPNKIKEMELGLFKKEVYNYYYVFKVSYEVMQTAVLIRYAFYLYIFHRGTVDISFKLCFT